MHSSITALSVNIVYIYCIRGSKLGVGGLLVAKVTQGFSISLHVSRT